MVGQHAERMPAEQAKKTQNVLQRFQTIAVAITRVMTMAMNRVSGIDRAIRTIPRQVGKTNLHAIQKQIRPAHSSLESRGKLGSPYVTVRFAPSTAGEPNFSCFWEQTQSFVEHGLRPTKK